MFQLMLLNYCPFQKIVRPTVFRITQERNELETFGFHHSRENTAGHKSMLNLIGPAVDQSGEFLKTFRPMKFLKHFYI